MKVYIILKYSVVHSQIHVSCKVQGCEGGSVAVSDDAEQEMNSGFKPSLHP